MQDMELLKISDLIAIMKVSRSSVIRMRDSGRMPAPVALSKGCLRWRAADIRQWIEDGCQQPGKEESTV